MMPHSEAKRSRLSESPHHPQATGGLANLASICRSGCDFVELVCENGRGASKTIRKSPSSSIKCSCHTLNSAIREGFNTKRARYTILPDASVQDGYHPELYTANLNDSSHDNKQDIDSLNLNLVSNSTSRICLPSPENQSRKITLDSMTESPGSKLHKQDSITDKKIGLMNFSHFLRPAALVKSFGATTRPTNIPFPGLSRTEELKCNDESSAAADTSRSSSPVESTPVVESATGSEYVTEFKNQTVPVRTIPDLILPTDKPQKEPFLDEYSNAACEEDLRKEPACQVPGRVSSLAASAVQRMPDVERSIVPLVASSSVGSHVASNYPSCYLERKHQDIEESTYPSENDEEDPEDVVKAVPARGNNGARRNRTAQVHNLSERRRRYKINRKMRALQELIPNCDKEDKASILDEAIEYMKTLELQVQMMSMGCMPQLMLHRQIYAPHLPHFIPFSAGMGMRVGMGVGCSPSQFPTSGIPGAGFQMPGLPGQVLPMSLSRAPGIPFPEGLSAQSGLLSSVSGSGTDSIVEHPASAPTSSSMNSIQNINFDMLHNTFSEHSRNQTLCQATGQKSCYHAKK